MRRVGWAGSRLGPLRDRLSALRVPARTRTLRWRLASPNGSAGLSAGVRGLWYKVFRPRCVNHASDGRT